jgi:hypothetical protein
MALQNRSLKMGGYPVEGVADATEDDHAINKGQFDATVATLAPLDSPALTGDPTAPTPSASDNDTSIATTAFVQTELADYAPLASPALTGNPTAPTQSADDNSTKIATTAYADTAAANAGFDVIYTTSDFSMTSGTWTDVTDLTIALEASSVYSLEYTLPYSPLGGNTEIGLNGPSGQTFLASGFPAANGLSGNVISSYDTAIINDNAGTGSNSSGIISVIFITTTAGDLDVRIRRTSGAGTATIFALASCRYKKIG